MESIFTKIINGQVPCYKVAEDKNNFAFLDIAPVIQGHTLVIPKKQVDKLFDLSREDYLNLMMFSQKIAKAIEKSFDCNRVGMTIVGLEVPHAHIHLMPINVMSDMDLFKDKLKLTEEEFKETALRIQSLVE